MLEEEEYLILDASQREEACVKFYNVAIVEFGNTLHPPPEIMAVSEAWASLVTIKDDFSDTQVSLIL